MELNRKTGDPCIVELLTTEQIEEAPMVLNCAAFGPAIATPTPLQLLFAFDRARKISDERLLLCPCRLHHPGTRPQEGD